MVQCRIPSLSGRSAPLRALKTSSSTFTIPLEIQRKAVFKSSEDGIVNLAENAAVFIKEMGDEFDGKAQHPLPVLTGKLFRHGYRLRHTHLPDRFGNASGYSGKLRLYSTCPQLWNAVCPISLPTKSRVLYKQPAPRATARSSASIRTTTAAPASLLRSSRSLPGRSGLKAPSLGMENGRETAISSHWP